MIDGLTPKVRRAMLEEKILRFKMAAFEAWMEAEAADVQVCSSARERDELKAFSDGKHEQMKNGYAAAARLQTILDQLPDAETTVDTLPEALTMIEG